MCQTLKKAKQLCEIKSNQSMASSVYEMILYSPEIVQEATPGQFVNLYCHHLGRLLPRPISICEINKEQGLLHLVYATLGDGTKEFSTYKAGESIEVMGPFGHGFELIDGPSLIVGGGVGTPPLVELAKQLKGEKIIVVGFRTEPYLIERLERYGKVYVATDDGSVGYQGHVVGLLEQEGITLGNLYACGPTPMLKGLQAYAAKNHMQAQLSLEERMGCGFGGCVGCVVKVPSNNEVGYSYKKVCKDGPVFDAKEVIFS